MNKKSTILLSILIASSFLFLDPSSSFSQQKDEGSLKEIFSGIVVENKDEGVPASEITEERSSSLIQAQENKIKENPNNDISDDLLPDTPINLQKNIENDKIKYNDKIRKMELLSIAIIILFVISLLFNIYIFTKVRKKLF